LIRHNLYVLSRRAAENKRRSANSSKGLPAIMPSLLRLLFLIGLFGGVVFICAAALVAFVEPQSREISQPIDPELLNK
jgi:hypothetical protein